MTDHTKSPKTTVNKIFNAVDAEITFQSSDDILFNIHRKNLEATAGVLAPTGFSTSNVVIPLPEDAATLELLFQFIYPGAHPLLDSDDIKFKLLDSLAEAAEKYEVSAARSVCHIRMTLALHEHPMEVVRYAEKHDYPKLLSETAAAMIVIPLLDVVSGLPQHLIIPWIRYYEDWRKVHTDAFSYPREHTTVLTKAHPVSEPCKDWPTLWSEIAAELGSGVTSLTQIDTLFKKENISNCCEAEIYYWSEEMIKMGIREIPSFSTFCKK